MASTPANSRRAPHAPYSANPDVHSWFLSESIIPFSSIEQLTGLLDGMSAVDYAAKAAVVELNFHRAQAWTHMDDGILLETDFLSTAPFSVSACKCGTEEYVNKSYCAADHYVFLLN